MSFDLNTALIIILAAIQAYSNYRDYSLNRNKNTKNEYDGMSGLQSELDMLKQRVDMHDRETRDKSADDKQLEKYVLDHERRLSIFERDIKEFKEDIKEFKETQSLIFSKIDSTNSLIISLTSGKKND